MPLGGHSQRPVTLRTFRSGRKLSFLPVSYTCMCGMTHTHTSFIITDTSTASAYRTPRKGSRLSGVLSYKSSVLALLLRPTRWDPGQSRSPPCWAKDRARRKQSTQRHTALLLLIIETHRQLHRRRCKKSGFVDVRLRDQSIK